MSFNYSEIQLIRGVLHQSETAAKNSARLSEIIWNNVFLFQETKVRIYKTIIRSILTYSVKTSPDTIKTKQKRWKQRNADFKKNHQR